MSVPFFFSRENGKRKATGFASARTLPPFFFVGGGYLCSAALFF